MGRAKQRKKLRGVSPSKSGDGFRGSGATSSAGLGWLAPLAIVALGVAVYANSFSVPFLFDDYFVIVSNPEAHSVAPVGRFLTQSRGLPHLLDALNYSWGGEQVWGYHLVNVVVHLINALLVFGLMLVTLRLPIHHGRYERRAAAMALVVALVFVAHPLQTMAVTYIVQRAESLAALFHLSAVLLFVAVRSGQVALRGPVLVVSLLGLGFLGILSKETVASLPAILLLYHFCFLRDGSRASGDSPDVSAVNSSRNFSGLDWRLIVVALIPVLYGVFLARHFLLPGFGDADGAQSAWLFIPSAGLGVEGVDPWRYLITQFGVIVWYLRLYLLPTWLCFDYGWPFAENFFSAGVLIPLLFLLCLVGAAVTVFSRYRWPLFCAGWFFLMLAPSSSVIPIRDAAFEYRMYLPMLGPTLLIVVGVVDWLDGLSSGRRAALRTAAVVAGCWVAALACGTIVRNQTLQSELSLAQDSARKAPMHWRNHFGLGSALVAAGRGAEAIEHFERAVEVGPEQGTPRIMLADLYSRAGRLAEAEDVVLPATESREESVSAAAYRQLGKLYKAQSFPAAAVGMFEEALVRKPRWRTLELEIVRLLRHQGEWHEAAMRLNELAAKDGSYARRLDAEIAESNLLGGVEAFERGGVEFARNMLGRALEHPSEIARATHMLAYVEAVSGRREVAVGLLEDLVRRDLGDDAIRANLERAESGEDLVVPLTTGTLGRR